MEQVKNNRYVLVTGGAGYIGSHTCKMLSQMGYIPIVFDNFSNGHLHAVKYGPYVEGDLNDVASIFHAFEKYTFCSVIHFASFIEVGESVSNPEKYYLNNVCGLLNLLHVMRKKNVLNIVFSSSCAVYGQPETVPITEITPKFPLSPYGKNKMIIEEILSDYDQAYNFRFVSCRYFNACGADSDGELGEEHTPETHIIPRLFMVALNEMPYFEIYGTDYDTVDGTCIRDYIHVQDLARAHTLSLKYLEEGGKSHAVNLGTGTGYSVREMVSAVEKITGLPLKIIEKPRRCGDPSVLLADTKKAVDILNFKVMYSDLDFIVETAWNFYRKSREPLNKSG